MFCESVKISLFFLFQDSVENLEIGMDYMRQAACCGDRASMIFLAKAYDSGTHVRLVHSDML